MKIGVTALQGAFTEHITMLRKCGAEVFEIRKPDDLRCSFDGIVISGGECTFLSRMLLNLDLMTKLQKLINSGLAVMGISAGLPLLAQQIEDGDFERLGTMKMTAVYHFTGKKLGAVHTSGTFKGLGTIPMTYIRPPFITQVNGANILAQYNGKIAAARQGKQLAVSFHPELDDSTLIYEYFIDMIRGKV